MAFSYILFLVCMPLTYGFVGWVTNWLALKMTFYPLEFKGFFPPYLGWQGIIPRKGYRMAGTYVDVITERLLTVEEVIQRVKPEVVAEKLQAEVEGIIDELVEEVGQRLYPDLWRMLPAVIKSQIGAQARGEVPTTIKTVFEEIRERITQVFDIKDLVYSNLTGKNITTLVDMFQRVGAPEFKFIERCGLYFGFILGGIQVVLWILFPYWWTLPLQGILVGYLTNWLALRMIFRPLRERKYGPFRYQGLFLKRQKEVSDEFSKLVATRILTAHKILNHILYGEAADSILKIVQRKTSEGFERAAGFSRPILQLATGNQKYDEMKDFIVERMQNVLRESASKLHEYMDEAMDLEKTMAERMEQLEPEEFEYLLRSAFKEDEMLLILVGAALGALIGTAQAALELFF